MLFTRVQHKKLLPNILPPRGTGCGSWRILTKLCCVLTLTRPLFINNWGLWASTLQQLSLKQKFINFSKQYANISRLVLPGAVLSHSLITQVVWSRYHHREDRDHKLLCLLDREGQEVLQMWDIKMKDIYPKSLCCSFHYRSREEFLCSTDINSKEG